MPDARLQRTRDAYREPTHEERAEAWEKFMRATEIVPPMRTIKSESGYSVIVSDPILFTVR